MKTQSLAADQFSLVDLDLNAPTRHFALLQRAHDTGLLSITLCILPSITPEDEDELGRETQENIAPMGRVGAEWVPQGPRLSPDGHSLAFFGNGRLSIGDVATGAVRPLLDRPDLDASFCEWAPDGKQLVFSAFPPPGLRSEPGLGPDIYILDIATGTARRLTADSAVNRFPQWVSARTGFSDGQRRAYVAFHRQDPPRSDTPKKIVLINTVTGEERQLPSAPDATCQVCRFCSSPDGEYVVYCETGSTFTGVRVAGASNGEVVWSLEREVPCAAAFTPDGYLLLIVSGPGDELHWFAFPGGELRTQSTPEQGGPRVKRTLSGPVLAFPVHSPGDGCRATTNAKEEVLFLGTDSRVYRWAVSQGGCAAAMPSPRGTPLPERPVPELRVQEERYESVTRDGRQTPVHRFVPQQGAKALAVLFLHGGPPASGTAAFAGAPHFTRDLLLRAGYELIVPAYRGMDENEGEYGRADLWDVMDAARDWHQRLGQGRPLAVVGYSYGGYLALLALAETLEGGMSAAPAARAAFSGFSRGAALWPVTQPFGLHMPRWYPADADEQAQAERLPAARAKNICAPLLILAGGRDRISTDPAVVAKIERLLTERGIPCQATSFADDTHGLPRSRTVADSLLLGFLAKDYAEEMLLCAADSKQIASR